MEINLRVEYGDTPIRNVAVQCPCCMKWFRGNDALDKFASIAEISFKSRLRSAHFYCPICQRKMEAESMNIKECNNANEVYEDCMKRKVVWEESF